MLVKNIKFVNNKVEVILDKKSFFISKENYIENPITIDSEITKDKIEYLLEFEQVIECKIAMIKLLNRKALSEFEVIKKIKEFEINAKYISSIVNSLKNAGLINDEFVATLSVEKELLKRKGKKAIRKLLIEKRIKDEIINKVLAEIDEDIYKENFEKTVSKYLKMYDKKNYKMKEQMLKQKLEELGYESSLISTVSIDKNSEYEVSLAVKNLIKILKSKKLTLDNYENVNKIKIKLATKGFSYDIINLAIEEVKNYETY